MGKKKVSQQTRNRKAAVAGIANATAGRARTFADRNDKLAANKGDSEISEGLEEYAEKKSGVNDPDLEDVVLVDVYIKCPIALVFPKGKTPTGDAFQAEVEKKIADAMLGTDIYSLYGGYSLWKYEQVTGLERAYDLARKEAKKAGDQYMLDHPDEPKSDPRNKWTMGAVRAGQAAFRDACKSLKIPSIAPLPKGPAKGPNA